MKERVASEGAVPQASRDVVRRDESDVRCEMRQVRLGYVCRNQSKSLSETREHGTRIRKG